jgi:hypothetical protein
MEMQITITSRAQDIARHYGADLTQDEAMLWSAAIEDGYSAGYETSYLDNGRMVKVYGFARSTSQAHADCLAKRLELVALGFKPTGSSEFNMRRFVPAAIEQHAPAIGQAA